jgi:hypothetical protein
MNAVENSIVAPCCRQYYGKKVSCQMLAAGKTIFVTKHFKLAAKKVDANGVTTITMVDFVGQRTVATLGIVIANSIKNLRRCDNKCRLKT